MQSVRPRQARLLRRQQRDAEVRLGGRDSRVLVRLESLPRRGPDVVEERVDDPCAVDGARGVYDQRVNPPPASSSSPLSMPERASRTATPQKGT